MSGPWEVAGTRWVLKPPMESGLAKSSSVAGGRNPDPQDVYAVNSWRGVQLTPTRPVGLVNTRLPDRSRPLNFRLSAYLLVMRSQRPLKNNVHFGPKLTRSIT